MDLSLCYLQRATLNYRVWGTGPKRLHSAELEFRMGHNQDWGLSDSGAYSPASQTEYMFSLRLRVDSLALLWEAAARRCQSQCDLSPGELEDLIGPVDDPLIDECLMVLTLPECVPGCVRLDTSMHLVSPLERALFDRVRAGRKVD